IREQLDVGPQRRIAGRHERAGGGRLEGAQRDQGKGPPAERTGGSESTTWHARHGTRQQSWAHGRGNGRDRLPREDLRLAVHAAPDSAAERPKSGGWPGTSALGPPIRAWL